MVLMVTSLCYGASCQEIKKADKSHAKYQDEKQQVLTQQDFNSKVNSGNYYIDLRQKKDSVFFQLKPKAGLKISSREQESYNKNMDYYRKFVSTQKKPS